MIAEWYGVFDRKGELYFVEQLEENAEETVLRLGPGHFIAPVTVIDSSLDDFTVSIFKAAQEKVPGFPRAEKS